jgi:flagellar hook-associated protein 3 FlgL
MNRVSTASNYSAILANLQAAQQRQMEAGAQVASQKKGDDLKSYARNAEMLTAMRSVQVRGANYIEQNAMVADKLATQDSALNQVAAAATGVRETIAEALASGRADTLVEDIQAQFRMTVEGLNARYGGKYLFAGGQIDTKPMAATALSDLVPAASVASFFKNDQFVIENKVDEGNTIATGVLADAVGTGMMTAFKAFQTEETTGSGPFNGELTDAQRTFLEGQLAVWDKAHADVTNIAGRNGLLQRRVDSVKDDLTSRQTLLKEMVGGITDVDMAEAATNLQAAGIAVQAAAQVFMSLQQSSLLNLLRS